MSVWSKLKKLIIPPNPVFEPVDKLTGPYVEELEAAGWMYAGRQYGHHVFTQRFDHAELTWAEPHLPPINLTNLGPVYKEHT